MIATSKLYKDPNATSKRTGNSVEMVVPQIQVTLLEVMIATVSPMPGKVVFIISIVALQRASDRIVIANVGLGIHRKNKKLETKAVLRTCVKISTGKLMLLVNALVAVFKFLVGYILVTLFKVVIATGTPIPGIVLFTILIFRLQSGSDRTVIPYTCLQIQRKNKKLETKILLRNCVKIWTAELMPLVSALVAVFEMVVAHILITLLDAFIRTVYLLPGMVVFTYLIGALLSASDRIVIAISRLRIQRKN